MSSHTPEQVPSQSALGSARMASEERRQQIVQVAMRLFSERGFNGTTTKEIARAAGVSEAIIFRHFTTKEELYAAILDHKACAGGLAMICQEHKGVAEAIERGDDRAFFEGFARAMLEHHEQDVEFMRLLLHSALEAHDLFRMFWDRNVSEMSNFMHGYIRQRQEAGALRQIEPLIIARAFIGMIVNHSMVNNLFDTSRSLLDISNERAAREFADILLRGVATSAVATTANSAPKRSAAAQKRSAATGRRKQS